MAKPICTGLEVEKLITSSCSSLWKRSCQASRISSFTKECGGWMVGTQWMSCRSASARLSAQYHVGLLLSKLEKCGSMQAIITVSVSQ